MVAIYQNHTIKVAVNPERAFEDVGLNCFRYKLPKMDGLFQVHGGWCGLNPEFCSRVAKW